VAQSINSTGPLFFWALCGLLFDFLEDERPEFIELTRCAAQMQIAEEVVHHAGAMYP
jgi:hypothetical protein